MPVTLLLRTIIQLPQRGGTIPGGPTRASGHLGQILEINPDPCRVADPAGKVGDAKLLLQAGAYVNVRDQKGTSALFTACFHGHAAMVELLLAAGADAVMQNAAGESPVYISSLRGHFDVVVLLLQHFERHGIPWQVPAYFISPPISLNR